MKYNNNLSYTSHLKMQNSPLQRSMSTQYKTFSSHSSPKIDNLYQKIVNTEKEIPDLRNFFSKNEDIDCSNFTQKNIYCQERNLSNNSIYNNLCCGTEKFKKNILKNRKINSQYFINKVNKLEKCLENKNFLIEQFQELMENCYEKIKKYKNENSNLKHKIKKNNQNNFKGYKHIEHLGDELSKLIIENRKYHEQYENQLIHLLNKLESIGNKLQ